MKDEMDKDKDQSREIANGAIGVAQRTHTEVPSSVVRGGDVCKASK